MPLSGMTLSSEYTIEQLELSSTSIPTCVSLVVWGSLISLTESDLQST